MRSAHFLLFILFSIFLASCAAKESSQHAGGHNGEDHYDLEEIQQSGEIIILTLYGPTSYFDYRGTMMGYHYMLSEQFGLTIGAKVRVEVARNQEDLVDRLLKGDGDLIAYNLPMTADLRKKLIFCADTLITHQVLVQRKGKEMIKDVTELVGKDIHVSRPRFLERMKHLNEELGGGINIHEIAPDSLTTEDLVRMVSEGKIDYTIAEDDLLSINEKAYSNLDFSVAVSFDQRSSWAVRKDSPELAKAIDSWFESANPRKAYLASAERFFDKDKPLASKVHPKAAFKDRNAGIISDYDASFRRNAHMADMDWRMMAAQAYQESGFDENAVSFAGARGLMQIMPYTAENFNMDPDRLFEGSYNIECAAKILKRLNQMYSSISDPSERQKFVLAAYNAGPQHIQDARALTRKYGKDPNRWTNNVDRYVLLMSEEEYYRDPVVKGGYFRSHETYSYVQTIVERTEQYRKAVRR